MSRRLKAHPKASTRSPTRGRILIANGVNLDLLGRREEEHYGSFSLHELEEALRAQAAESAPDFELAFFQTNAEADYLAEISKAYTGMILNPAAWTHTSLALRDRLKALKPIFIEVHISNIHARSEIRQRSMISDLALGVISGLGMDSYLLALRALTKHLKSS